MEMCRRYGGDGTPLRNSLDCHAQFGAWSLRGIREKLRVQKKNSAYSCNKTVVNIGIILIRSVPDTSDENIKNIKLH